MISSEGEADGTGHDQQHEDDQRETHAIAIDRPV
jgi:hypothetical protein